VEGGTRYIRETIADLDAAGLSADRRRLVDEGNVRRLIVRRRRGTHT
jgi:hypothetical protein